MDLSIFESVFALRDEARKAQLDADPPDLSRVITGANRGEIVQPPSLPQEELAIQLMARAMALHEQAVKSNEKNDRPVRGAISELLHSATASFPIFDESGLARGLVTRVGGVQPAAVETETPPPVKKSTTRKRK